MIKAILLVPEKGDPHGLLKDGPCGARPSMAYLHPGGITVIPEPKWFPGKGSKSNLHALALAWEGKPAVEGCYRAADCAGISPSAVRGVVPSVLDGDGAPGHISALGTIILLDEHGVEVTA